VLTEKLESMNLEELAELKKEVAAFIKTKKEGDKERRAAEKQKKAEWATYRQALRDFMASYNDSTMLKDVTWPTIPSA